LRVRLGRCEAAAETAQVEPPTNDVAVRKDEFVEYSVACVDAAMSANGPISAPLIEAIGQRLAEINDEWQQKIEKLKTRVAELEQIASLHARFSDLERNLDMRQQARDAIKKAERGERGPRGETGQQGRPGRDGKDAVAVTKLIGVKR
jgi:hypothetical protein